MAEPEAVVTAEPEAVATVEPAAVVTSEPEAVATVEPEVVGVLEPAAEPTGASVHDVVLHTNEQDSSDLITMLLPAVVGIVTLVSIITVCSLLKKRKLHREYTDSTGQVIRPWKQVNSAHLPWIPLLTDSDLQVLYELALFPYSIHTLLLMSIPAIMSLAFLPIGTIIRNPVIDALWPDGSFHDASINDVIACFLLPAGLVYAIAFGFAFQQAASSQAAYHQWLVTQYVLVRQQLVMLGKLKHADVGQKMEILQLLKNSVISCCMSVMGHKELHTYEASDDSFEIQSRLCDIKEELEASEHSSTQMGFCDMLLDMTLRQQIQIKIIDTLRSDMNACLWTFLELLGYFAFIGILLVDAKSYRMELAMCFCTVFSISMFSYILGDLDHPFHGLFRVHLTPLFEINRLLEETYMELASRGHKNIPSHIELKYIRSSEHVVRI